MFKKKGLQLGLLTMLFAMVGCQSHEALNRAGAEPEVPSVQAHTTDAVERQQTVITVHLAQQEAESSLIPVQLTEEQALYALPDPVFTHGDMLEVAAARTSSGATFVVFSFTPEGGGETGKY